MTHGYCFSTQKECDLLEEGIVDSCLVIRTALQNAVSVATMIMTSETVVTEIPSEGGEDHDHHHEEEGVGAF